MGTMKIAIIGLGLIGGSMAKAIKENTSHTVYGYDKNDTVEKKALLLGAIDEVLTDEILSQCDLTLIALYPQAAVDFIRKKQTGGTYRAETGICLHRRPSHGRPGALRIRSREKGAF